MGRDAVDLSCLLPADRLYKRKNLSEISFRISYRNYSRKKTKRSGLVTKGFTPFPTPYNSSHYIRLKTPPSCRPYSHCPPIHLQLPSFVIHVYFNNERSTDLLKKGGGTQRTILYISVQSKEKLSKKRRVGCICIAHVFCCLEEHVPATPKRIKNVKSFQDRGRNKTHL